MDTETQKISNGFDEVADKIRVAESFYDEVLRSDSQYHGDVLDIGCGHGIVLKKLLTHEVASLTGVDISRRVIESAQRNVPTAKCEVAAAERLPFEGSSFDYVFMLDTIQYLPNFAVALREAWRVLKPDGTFICNFANKDWILFRDEYFRIRKKIPLPIEEQFFTFQEMSASLRAAGFKIFRYKGADCFRYYAPYHRYEEMLANLIPWMHRHMKKVVFKCQKPGAI